MLSKEEHEELMAKVASVSELTELNKELERIKKELEADHEALKMKVIWLLNYTIILLYY